MFDSVRMAGLFAVQHVKAVIAFELLVLDTQTVFAAFDEIRALAMFGNNEFLLLYHKDTLFKFFHYHKISQ